MRALRFIILILGLLLLIVPSMAQSELDNTYDWPNGISVSYPDGWDIVEEDNGVHLRSDETNMFFAFEDYEDEDDVEEALETLFNMTRSDTSIDFESDNVFFGGLSNFSLTASYFFEDSADGEGFQRALFAIPVDEAIIVQVAAVPLEAHEIDELSIVLNILSSLDYNPERATEESAEASESEEGVYRWPSGVSIQYPPDWDIVEEADITHIVNADIDIAIYLYPVRDERDTNHAAAIRETFATISTKTFDEEAFYFLELANDAQALAYSYEESLDGADFEQMLVALQPDDIFVAVAVVLPRTVETFDAVGGRQAIYDMLATMRFD
jgi:hypothetical protein